MPAFKTGKSFTIPAALAVTATLAACGDTVTDQALLGGAAGAGVAVVASGSVLTGAAVGAGANLLYCQTYPSKCK